MAKISRIGYGQVEPNHLSAQRNGQVYAQLPCASSIKVLENGQFVKYDYPNGTVNFSGAGEWMLVMNEVKVYDARESYKDFALDATKMDMTPRVYATHVGDIFTTNCLEKAGEKGVKTETTNDIAVNDVLKINANGFLDKEGTSADEFTVVKVYTMPDGQQGVKVVRTK